MNGFFPSSIQTQIELEEIADVKRQIITPATSRTIIGIVQDGLIGAYNLTSPNMRIDWKNAMNIMSYTSIDDFASFKKKEYSGYELFSMIVPPKINVNRKGVVIKNGILEQGYITKDFLGSKKQNSLTQLIWDEYGVEMTQEFLNNTQKLVNNFNLFNGFTVGIQDAAITKEVAADIKKIIETKELKVNHIITELENNPDMMDNELFERTIFSELNIVREDVAKLMVANISPDNKFNIMMKSGSKGDEKNLTLMGGVIGLQAFEGKLVPKKLNNRTLPYFFRDEDSASARGFIKRTFISGMTFPEFFFNNMTGREGLIDQAIKSVTGDTEIVVIENGKPSHVKIGDWIDTYLKNNETKVKKYVEQEMEILNVAIDPQSDDTIKQELYIPTTDEDGNVSWGNITALIRHDPGKELFEVKTLGGRKVIVTESKSLLIWNPENHKFEHTLTANVKPGDYMPVTMKLNTPKMFTECNTLIGEILNEPTKAFNKYIGSEKEITGNKETINIMNMLCNLNGKMTKITDYNLTIIDTSTDFPIQNDVVLDKIVEINKVDVNKYPKVYDLTIPSTLNFGLANGLHVVDTSQSGYIQRKLIKLQEDYMVKYDGTVRSAVNQIIQFIYGDSGADTTRQYEYTMKMLEQSDTDIEKIHKFTESEMDEAKITKKDNDEIYELILSLRDKLRITQIKTRMNWIVLQTVFMLPVNVSRIIDNYRNDEKLKHQKSEKLTTQYVIDTIERILSNENTTLLTMKKEDRQNKNSIKYQDDKTAKTSLLAALFDSLSPKRAIIEYKLNKAQLDAIANEIIKSFNKNQVEPGEMVGIIAAQSEGECVTQLSVVSHTRLKIIETDKDGKIIATYNGPINEFIDRIIDDSRKVNNKMNNVIVLEKPNKNGLESVVCHPSSHYYIASVSENEKIEWTHILEISRHPANGQLIKVTTKSGRTTTATLSHSFLTRKDNKVIPIRGSELKVGTRIPILKKLPTIKNSITKLDGFNLDNSLGWLCGAYLADGSINGNNICITKMAKEFEVKINSLMNRFNTEIKINHKHGSIKMKGIETIYDDREYEGKDIIFNHKRFAQFLNKYFSKGSYDKKIDGMIYATNKDFIAGIVAGYFDGDGNIQFDKGHQSIRAHSVNEFLIQDMSLLINYLGMHTTISQEKKKDQINNLSKGIYYTLHVPIKYCQTFKDSVPLVMKDKIAKLDQIIEWYNRDHPVGYHESIDMIPGLGETIAAISDKLQLEGNSRLYKQFIKREAIGRQTLGKFIQIFKDEIKVQTENYYLSGDELIKANQIELEKRNQKQAKRQEKQYERKVKQDNNISKPILKPNNNKFVLKQLNENDQIDMKTKLQILEDAYNSDVIWDEIINLEILDDPKEYVYDFSVPGLESFMVDAGILVHNTLNSVDWTENILIKDNINKKYRKYTIGEYIDKLVEDPRTQRLGDNIDNEMGDTYYLDIKDKQQYIESVDENGKIEWKLIEAVTKHLPINKDGSNTLLKITTRSGRTVSATKAKSFLTRVDNKIVFTRGDELVIGSRLPVKIDDTYDETIKENRIIPGNNIPGFDNIMDKYDILKTYKKSKHDLSNEQINIIEAIKNADVYYDEIISIEEVEPTHKYVYDFTVADTRTFGLFNGLQCADSFHLAGVRGMVTTTQGVPRIAELLSLTRTPKTPQMAIMLTKEYANSRDMANKIASYIEFTSLGDLRGKLSIYYDIDPYRKGGFIEQDKAVKIYTTSNVSKNSCQSDITNLPWLLRIELNREKLLKKEVTLVEIKSKLCHLWERRHNDKMVKKEEKHIFENITQIAIMSNTDYDKVPVLHIRFDMVKFDLVILNSFIDMIVDNFKLKGMGNITGTDVKDELVVTFDGPNHAIEKQKSYFIYTQGTNLYDIRFLNNIDINNTITNDIVAMYETFGIEAARTILYREWYYAYDRAGATVNYQHLALSADMMTFNGTLTSIDRHGMNKTDTGPLSRSTFEKTVDILLTAAVFSETDNMNSVSSRIMAGQVIKGGTGYCNVILDTDMIQQSEFTEDIGQKYVRTYNEITKSNILNDIETKEPDEEAAFFIPE